MKKLQFLFVLSFLSLVSLCFAAEQVELRDAQQVLRQMQDFRGLGMLSLEDSLQVALRLGPESSLRLLRTISEGRNVTHRYILEYKGVSVWGEHIVITTDANAQPVRLHGKAVVGIENDVESVVPSFDAATALNLMKARQQGARSNQEWIYENEKSELVIYARDSKARLSYHVTFFADVKEGGQPTRPVYILDAHTQEVIWEFEGLTHNEGTGPGGNTKTGRYRYGAEYPAFEVAYNNGTSTMENEYVKTVNLNHGSSGSTAYSYAGTENTVKEINGAFSPLNDAHFFGAVVFRMYKDWYNTAPLTFKLTMKVHYSNSYENAFWNGSSMTFGDGKSRFFPLVSLDVSCHEVSHGFTEQNSGLNYSAQSGGINEAFSDIAGEASEYFMKNTNDWMVGAEIFKSTGALRYLNDPPKDGKSIGSAKNYTNGMDVHYSSGVFNKAFYLLATKPGWNTKKAFDVFVKANQKYWTPSSNFVVGAKGVMDAAKDYGYSTADVVSAFAGVDVVIAAE